MIRSNLNIKFFFIIKIILIYLLFCSKSYSDSIATNTSLVVLGQDNAPVKIKIFSLFSVSRISFRIPLIWTISPREPCLIIKIFDIGYLNLVNQFNIQNE